MSKKFVVNVNGKNYDVEVTEVLENKSDIQEKKIEVPVETSSVPVNNKTEVNNTLLKEGCTKVIAPMPGTILKISVESGQKVKKGEVLLILEAMKMENDIVSPCDGRIVSINVSKGSKVNAGDLMVTIEGV